jgi:hypothetical protein
MTQSIPTMDQSMVEMKQSMDTMKQSIPEMKQSMFTMKQTNHEMKQTKVSLRPNQSAKHIDFEPLTPSPLCLCAFVAFSFRTAFIF